jgi:uncharacterized membrane protein
MNIKIFELGFILTLIGLGVIIASFLLAVIKGKAKVNGGCIVLIGPIPLIFIANKKASTTLILISLIILLVVVLLTLHLF